MSKPKIVMEMLQQLFYKQRLPAKEVAQRMHVAVSSIGSFRAKHHLPPRGWATGHPMLGKHHSVKTRKQISLHQQLKNGTINKAHEWKGMSSITTRGYRFVKSPDASKYIFEHRHVMEQHLGRTLFTHEVVHHKNGNKLDNRLTNLCLHTRSEHSTHHFPKGSKFGIHASQS